MRVRLLGSLAAALLAGTAAAAAGEPVRVLATFSILGDMAARVGGEAVAVTTLVGPGGDAHVYQPTPADAQAIAGADVVIVNGLGFEGFLDRLMDASGYRGPVITATAGIEPLPATPAAPGEGHDDDHGGDEHGYADHGHDDHGDHGDEAAHDHGPVDPHAWQDLSRAVAYVQAIEDGLCEAAPAACPTFRANGAAYRTELAALDAEIRARVAAVPENRRRVITSHDAFRYFGAAYGVRFIAPQGVSTESEASARDVAALIGQIRETGVGVVFVENVADPRLIRQIADETGAAVGGSLYSDALSAPGEPGETYLGMMRHNAEALIGAMEQGS